MRLGERDDLGRQTQRVRSRVVAALHVDDAIVLDQRDAARARRRVERKDSHVYGVSAVN